MLGFLRQALYSDYVHEPLPPLFRLRNRKKEKTFERGRESLVIEHFTWRNNNTRCAAPLEYFIWVDHAEEIQGDEFGGERGQQVE